MILIDSSLVLDYNRDIKMVNDSSALLSYVRLHVMFTSKSYSEPTSLLSVTKVRLRISYPKIP